jgi:hypothetical protein
VLDEEDFSADNRIVIVNGAFYPEKSYPAIPECFPDGIDRFNHYTRTIKPDSLMHGTPSDHSRGLVSLNTAIISFDEYARAQLSNAQTVGPAAVNEDFSDAVDMEEWESFFGDC